jgi:hypothetical protein
MGGISPIVLSWTARDQKWARVKALKKATDSAGRELRQSGDTRVSANARSQGRTGADRTRCGETVVNE